MCTVHIQGTHVHTKEPVAQESERNIIKTSIVMLLLDSKKYECAKTFLTSYEPVNYSFPKDYSQVNYYELFLSLYIILWL